MSDFLNNLAARALRRQEPLRPRLASRFEPPGAGLAPLPAGPTDVETTIFERTPDAPSTVRADAPPPFAPHHERDTPAQASAAQTPSPASTRPGDLAGEAGRASSESLRPAPAASRGRESAENRTPPAPADRTVGPPPTPPAPAETARRIEVVRHERRAAGAPEANIGGTEAPAGTEERVRELEARVASLEASSAREKALRESLKPAPLAAVALAPRPGPTPHTPAAAAPGLESGDEPPHVTVTIGRVDVRAVFPAAAEAPRRPAAPRPAPTTLAQYLEQRERGRR